MDDRGGADRDLDRSRSHVGPSGLPLGRLALVGAASGALAYAGFALRAAGPDSHLLGDVLAAVGLAGVPAVGLHLLVGLPDGRLTSTPRRALVVVGYGVAVVAASAWLLGSRQGVGFLVATGAVLAAAAGTAPANKRYRETTGVTRQRLQWIGCAIVFAAEVGLLVVALRILIGWPHQGGLVAAAGR
ncbi:MAG: hypothetical protein WKF43_15245 [Acidimicrobiales bacterium]